MIDSGWTLTEMQIRDWANLPLSWDTPEEEAAMLASALEETG